MIILMAGDLSLLPPTGEKLIIIDYWVYLTDVYYCPSKPREPKTPKTFQYLTQRTSKNMFLSVCVKKSLSEITLEKMKIMGSYGHNYGELIKSHNIISP